MRLLNDILKHGELFSEMRKSSVVSDEVIDSRLYKESTVKTKLQMETTINKAYYFCERAMNSIEGTVKSHGALFREAAKRGATDEDIFEMFQEGIKEIGATIWTTVVTLYKAFIAAINSVRAFFVSQKGVIRKLDKVVEILKANATKKPKAGAKMNIPMLIKTDATDKKAIVANLIKSINSLFVISEGGVYASAELHRSSGKVIVTDFDKYVSNIGSLDPLKTFAANVKELTKAAPSQETVLATIGKLAMSATNESDKNISVIDSLITAPTLLLATMVPIDTGVTRKVMTDPKGTSKILEYAKQMQQALAKKPVSTIMLDSITGEVSDKSLLPRLRANTVKYVSDEAYLNIPELAKGLEASKEQIKRLFVGKKENLAGLVGQIMTQTSKLLSQTKKSSASLDKVAKKAGNADGVNDTKGVDEILAAAKAIVTACNLLVKDYTRTVAECKIGINTLLNGVTKLVGKTISKEDGTGFEEDFEPEEDAKTGYTPVKRPGAKGSTTMPKLGAGRQRMGTGNKMSSFKDTKGYTKDVIAEVEEEHLSAKELAKRQAAVKKGANRNKR